MDFPGDRKRSRTSEYQLSDRKERYGRSSSVSRRSHSPPSCKYRRVTSSEQSGPSRLSAAECTLERKSLEGHSSGVHSLADSKVRCKEGRVDRSGEIQDNDSTEESMLFSPTLPEIYYTVGKDKKVQETNELRKLHEEFISILQLFEQPVPTRRSFLSLCKDDLSEAAVHDAESGELSSETPSGSGEGVVEKEMKRTVEKLHKYLPFNSPAKVPLFCCTEKYHQFGKCGAVDVTMAPSEEEWHCYQVTVTPNTNFQCGVHHLSKATSLSGQCFTFNGFSILSRHSLDSLPRCVFERYGGQYVIKLKCDPTHKNFTLKDVLLFEEFLFVKLLEMYDWIDYLKPFCADLFFIPRFCRKNGSVSEILSMAEVLKYLVGAYKPLVEADFSRHKNVDWMEGLLIAHHSKVPSCIRSDRVVFSRAKKKSVVVEHYCSQLQRKSRNHTIDIKKEDRMRYKELQHKSSQKKLSQKEYYEYNSLKRKCGGNGGTAWLHSQCGEDYLAIVTPSGFHNTGIYCDIAQNSLLLLIFSHHILLHDSLKGLQIRLGYQFSDSQLLHRALTHPSVTTSSFVVAEDHIRNALSNCGLRSPRYIRSSAPRMPKGIKGLIEAVRSAPRGVDETTRLQNNEQLEFLGDAILEYLCSNHLYHSHPDFNVGKLTIDRQLLVKNKHLTKVAEKIKLDDFILKNLKVVFTEEGSLHILGNCVEALLGAVFLDGGLDEADKLFARLVFPEEEKYKEWMEYDPHPLVKKYPSGDRHLLEESDLLKGMVPLEEHIGITFKHITLLTKAFVHPSCAETTITGGNYQRLEFLGDAILQFLASKFVYNQFPSHNEGHLSLLRTSLVHNKQLASICQQLGFDKFTITSRTEKLELSIKTKADLVESFLAALTLDQGLERAEKFLEEHLYPKLEETVTSSNLVDANTRLNQAAAYTCKQQGVGLDLPVFRLVSREGPTDKPVFTIAVHMGKKKLGVGSGSTMHEARINASETALQSGLLRIPPAQKGHS